MYIYIYVQYITYVHILYILLLTNIKYRYRYIYKYDWWGHKKVLVCVKVKIMRFLNTNKTENFHKPVLPKPKIKKEIRRQNYWSNPEHNNYIISEHVLILIRSVLSNKKIITNQ